MSAQANGTSTAPVEPYLAPTGPTVPRSHSFLPLRCGPPIYFPLPAPYDEFCLTGIFPSDLSTTEEAEGDVDMEGDADVKAGSSSRAGLEQVRALGAIEGTGGWEYPVIRRTSEISSLNTDSSISPSILGTFSLQPDTPSGEPSRHRWALRHVWIAPEERQKGLATLVITYILHSWLLRLPGTPQVSARADTSDEAGTKFLSRLGFTPADRGGTAGPTNGGSHGEVEYLLAR